MKLTPQNVDEYLASFPPDVQVVLRQVRSIIRRALPGAEEHISYGMPTYKVNGRAVLNFSGWTSHYALYGSTRPLVEAFGKKLAPYDVNAKGTIRFPLSAPVPARLIGEIARFRARRAAEREKASTQRSRRAHAKGAPSRRKAKNARSKRRQQRKLRADR